MQEIGCVTKKHEWDDGNLSVNGFFGPVNTSSYSRLVFIEGQLIQYLVVISNL